MLWSIYNWNSKRYDVYDSPTGEQNGQRPEPRKKVNAPNGRGRQLESLLPILPRDAKLVENSATPKGRIAIHWTSSAVGLGADESPFVTHPWLVMGVIVGGVWLGHKVLLAVARRF